MEAPKKYRLIYINYMGIAEPIRILFALAQVPYDDYRISNEDWTETKKKMPWGSVPVLELMEDGRQLSQSLAILRYLGREFGRAGKTAMQMAKVDEYIDSMHDIVQECMSLFFESDPEKKATKDRKLKEEVMPAFLGRLEKVLEKEGTGLLVGDDITIADIYVGHMLNRNDTLSSLEGYPLVRRHLDKVFQQPDIAKWVASRPKTVM